jgi:DNA repair protein RecO (recombination protein O)
MLIKCKAIVIHTVNYSESSVVLKCFTDLHGVQSYMVNGVRSKKGSIKPSQLMPLSLLELEVYHQPQKNLQRIKELKCSPQLKTIHFDLVKSTIGIFVAELIHKTVKEDNHTDIPLFTFLYNSIQILDLQDDKVSNFPLFFLLQLSKYLGFYPKGNYTQTTNGFDFREGVFELYNEQNTFQLSPKLSECISRLLLCDATHFQEITLTQLQRSTLLEVMIDYYKQHVSGFLELKSPKILSEILA